MSTAASVDIRTAGSAGFHLNRRGRFVLVGVPMLLLAALVTAAAVLLGAHAVTPAAASGDRPVPVETMTVDYGDTLWSIAGRVAPDVPRNETILRIGELNGLTGSELEPGQVLFIPRSS